MKNKKLLGAALGIILVGIIIAGINITQSGEAIKTGTDNGQEIAFIADEEQMDSDKSEFEEPDIPERGTGLVMTDIEEPDPDTETYIVTFYNEDGDIVDQQLVPEGHTAIPAGNGYSDAISSEIPKNAENASDAPVITPSAPKPPLTKEGKRFVEWDKPLDNIKENTEVHPVTEETKNDGTEVYSDAVYVKQNENTAFSLELNSSSEIAALQLIIKTDSTKLIYQGCQNLDSGVRVAQKDDEVRLSFLSNSNIEGKMFLGDLVFMAVGDAGTDAEIEVIVDKAVRIDDNEDLINTDVIVSNGLVHIF